MPPKYQRKLWLKFYASRPNPSETCSPAPWRLVRGWLLIATHECRQVQRKHGRKLIPWIYKTCRDHSYICAAESFKMFQVFRCLHCRVEKIFVSLSTSSCSLVYIVYQTVPCLTWMAAWACESLDFDARPPARVSVFHCSCSVIWCQMMSWSEYAILVCFRMSMNC